jgi:hypothetical protein
MDQSNTAHQTDPGNKLGGLSRRRVIRAGLSAAPVLAGLKSQSALATNGICTPSIWSSLKAANYCVSRGRVTQFSTCSPYTHWSTQNHNACGTKYHGSTSGCAGFGGTHFGTKTLKQVCGTTTTDKKSVLGRHCAAMHLNATLSSSSCPINVATCQDIWNKCGEQGVTWTPVTGGPAWSRDDCISYFDYVCGIKPQLPVCA